MTAVQTPAGVEQGEQREKPSQPRVACEIIDGVAYPYEEEEPTPQGTWHALGMNEIRNCTRGIFLDRLDIGIFTDIFVFWVRGDRNKKVAPDLMVLPTIENPERERKSVYLWREKTRPIFVMEVLSPKTAHDDMGRKFEIYQNELEIPEYFICRRMAQSLEVWGYRLVDGEYTLVEPDDEGRLYSEQLDAWVGSDEKGRFQLWDRSGQIVPSYERAIEQFNEAAERANQEFERANQEAALREKAEARVRELEEELRRRGP